MSGRARGRDFGSMPSRLCKVGDKCTWSHPLMNGYHASRCSAGHQQDYSPSSLRELSKANGIRKLSELQKRRLTRQSAMHREKEGWDWNPGLPDSRALLGGARVSRARDPARGKKLMAPRKRGASRVGWENRSLPGTLPAPRVATRTLPSAKRARKRMGLFFFFYRNGNNSNYV